jgi:large subunit ribosomal protein L39
LPSQRKNHFSQLEQLFYIFISELKYICILDMSEMLVGRSALAKVNGKLWDMHRPLEEDCELQLLHMKDADPYHVNKAFWRSCSVILGAVAHNAFKDNIGCELHSFPSPNGKIKI